MELNVYLNFNGQCEEAFKFYESALGGKIEAIMHFEGSPAAAQAPPDWANKVVHARMRIGDQVVMGSDPPQGWHHKPQGFSVSLSVKDPQEAERLFQALSEGATVKMPLAETFWATRFGALEDKFGIPWMINCEKPRPNA